MARDKVKEIRELILERYDKNFDGRLEINEVCEYSFFLNRNFNTDKYSRLPIIRTSELSRVKLYGK